jgi:hypothetical protein
VTEQDWSDQRGLSRKPGNSLAPFTKVVADLGRRDHASVWRGPDGSSALVLQPYHFELEQMREMVESATVMG